MQPERKIIMTDALKGLVRETAAKRKVTPQRERTPGRTDEVVNSAGGYVFQVDDLARLNRLLILGSAGNTYYVNAKDQAKEALQFVRNMIAKDEATVIEAVRSVSVEGRALRQTMTLFVLAALLTYAQDKQAVRDIFNDVVRTPTHLYEVCQYIDDLGGWGTAKTKAIAGWFTAQDADSLAYKAVKYKSRTV
jgi:60 kDa SS-A/Ro ribonucleoprotein